MKKRKIRIERIILAIGIYIIIGIIPLKFADTKVDKAKSKFAIELLAENRNYPDEVEGILQRASRDPNYAGKQIHVWDPDGRRGYRQYDAYIGGGSRWYDDGYIICNRGEDVADVIFDNRSRSELLCFISTVWFIGIPLLIIFAFASEAEESEDPGPSTSRKKQHYN